MVNNIINKLVKFYMDKDVILIIMKLIYIYYISYIIIMLF